MTLVNLTGCKNHNLTMNGLEGNDRNDAIYKLYQSLIVAMLFLMVELIGG